MGVTGTAHAAAPVPVAAHAAASGAVPTDVSAQLTAALARAAGQRVPAGASGAASALAQRHSAASAARDVCYAAHVENIGWQSPVCDGAIAGTAAPEPRGGAAARDFAVYGVQVSIVAKPEPGW